MVALCVVVVELLLLLVLLVVSYLLALVELRVVRLCGAFCFLICCALRVVCFSLSLRVVDCGVLLFVAVVC